MVDLELLQEHLVRLIALTSSVDDLAACLAPGDGVDNLQALAGMAQELAASLLTLVS